MLVLGSVREPFPIALFEHYPMAYETFADVAEDLPRCTRSTTAAGSTPRSDTGAPQSSNRSMPGRWSNPQPSNLSTRRGALQIYNFARRLTLHELSELYRQQGRYEEAKALFARASKIVEQTLGPDRDQRP